MPEITNIDRADSAQMAILESNKDSGYQSHSENITDLLANLMHLSDLVEVDFNRCLSNATCHYTEEKLEEEDDHANNH